MWTQFIVYNARSRSRPDNYIKSPEPPWRCRPRECRCPRSLPVELHKLNARHNTFILRRAVETWRIQECFGMWALRVESS